MIELSVVIPSRDAGTRLIFCLEALGKQRGAGGEFEVIVVDDGSLPPVEPSLHAPGDRFPLRVLRRDVPGGAGAARNVGWRVARGRVILFLDDDVVAGPDLLAGHLAAHADGGPTIGIGRLRSRAGPGAEWLARRFATAWNANVDALDGGRTLRAADCYGGNVSIATDLLQAVGGFDEGLARSEDIELAARLVDRGGRLVYVAADSEHRERKTGRRLLDDQRREGAVAPALIERHPWVLGEIPLGSYAATGPRQLMIRRLATAARIRPEVLIPAARLIGRGRRARSALTLLLHLAYWSGVRSSVSAEAFARMTDGTAILMYHAFAPAGGTASRFVVPIDRFERQLEALLRRGHRPLSLSAYLEYRRGHRFPPPRSFVVTIDDGYTEVEHLAAPVLRRLGIPATVFIAEATLGRTNSWDRSGPLAERAILDVDGLQRLRRSGLEIAAHSSTHAPLPGASPERLKAEIQLATERLSAKVGPVVPAFAYPFGLADGATRAAVAEAGLVGLGAADGLACPASPEAQLPRIEVQGTDWPLQVAIAARLGGTRRLLRP